MAIRGTSPTSPFSCYPNDQARSLALASDPKYSNASETAKGNLWAAKTQLADICNTTLRNTGRLVGTAFVARDVMQIVEALDEDGLLRYWGFSYGTVLGATVAAMFPDKIDKVILDGVINFDEYYAGTDLQAISDSDVYFEKFSEECFKDPQYCALAKDAATATELTQKLYHLLDHYKYNPVYLGPTIGFISYAIIKDYIVDSFYSTTKWAPLAETLHNLLGQNITGLAMSLTSTATSSGASGESNEALFGIRCSDSSLRVKGLDSLEGLVKKFYKKSEIMGDVQAVYPLTCAQWPFEAKERYLGGFHVRTKNPLFFVGNTYDPLSSIRCAQNMSAGFEGSALLQHDGYGVRIMHHQFT